MYLKKIEIVGFKSFGARNVLDFIEGDKQKGVAAVIGPNGSGKSNIADAIRWVLGEQSSRILRVKKNDEIIFFGNSKKAKASYSEVSLTLNCEGSTAVEFSEVEITRRLYRNGDNEYLLNKKRVRLLDILEFLSKCGFGHSTYTVIGQGMIDSLLFYGPTERKVFFEEASGVKQYEIKREQAKRKIESTDKNIIRIRDLLYELEPRLAVARKQYKRFENKQIIEEQLERISRIYYSVELKKMNEEIKRHQKELEILACDEKKFAEKSRKVNEEIKSQNSFNKKEKEDRINLSQILDELYQQKEDLYKKIYQKQLEIKTFDVTTEIERKTADLTLMKRSETELVAKKNELENGISEVLEVLIGYKDQLGKIDQGLIETEKGLNELQEEALGVDSSEVLKKLNAIFIAYRKFRLEFEKVSGLKELTILKRKEDLTNSRLESLITVLKKSESFDYRKLENAKVKRSELLSRKEEVLKKVQDARVKELSQKEILSNVTLQIKELKARIQNGETKLKELERKSSTAIDKDLLQAIKNLEGEKDKVEERIIGIKENLSLLEKKEKTLDSQYALFYQSDREVQNELARVREAIASNSFKLENCETKIVDLKREAIENFNESFFKLVKSNPEYSEDPKLFEKMSQLRKQYYALGEIDPLIKDEYDDLFTRIEELSNQLCDLEGAKEDLLKVTEELDRRIKTQFSKTFKQIATEFTNYFKILFGGGQASLVLEPNDNGFGVEINAIPPGKKNHSLASLSGGERTLTSIALLFAILSVNPSPFCVLDEVDAALDELNTQKFLKILKTIAKKSQFLLITHNRETMKEADLIYGVTMDENHISKTYFLRLSEVK